MTEVEMSCLPLHCLSRWEVVSNNDHGEFGSMSMFSVTHAIMIAIEQNGNMGILTVDEFSRTQYSLDPLTHCVGLELVVC